MIIIRNYKKEDYNQIKELYMDSDNFGGQFAEERDSEEKLRKLIESKEDSILIAVINEEIVGTVTLFEDFRAAWLYRFAVVKVNESEIIKTLSNRAIHILREKGHEEVLVYAPVGSKMFEDRYREIGFKKGGDYTCYYRNT